MPLALPFSRVVADISVVLSGLFFLAHCYHTHSWSWMRTPIAKLLGFTSLYITCATFWSPNFSLHLVGHAFAQIRFFLFFLAILYGIGPVKSLRTLLFITASVSVLGVACDTLYQYLTDFSFFGHARFHGRLTGTFRRPLVGFFLVTLFFPLMGFWGHHTRTLLQKILLFGAAFCISIICLLTGDRSASLLLLLGFSWVAVAFVWYHPQMRWTLLGGVISVLLLLTLLVLIDPYILSRTRLLQEQILNFSVSCYGQIAHTAFLTWKTSPFFGAGYKSFSAIAHSLYAQGIVTYLGCHAHNYYLTWLANMGLVGLALFIAFIIRIVHQVGCSKNTWLRVCCLATLLVIFWPLTTTNNFFHNNIAALNWFTFGLVWVLSTFPYSSR